jgi:NAD-dependent SIR2 family protein deacetylase
MKNRCVQHGPLELPLDSLDSLRKARCPQCGRAPRPDVVLFYESLPEEDFRRAHRAVQALQRDDVMVVVGTTGAVGQPVAVSGVLSEQGPLKSHRARGAGSLIRLCCPVPFVQGSCTQQRPFQSWRSRRA